MSRRKIITACPVSHTKHINALCGQNIKFLTLNIVIYMATTGLKTLS
jgi:hypothetical protein